MSTGWTGNLQTASSLTLWGQIKESAVPILAYWVWLGFAYFTFGASIAITESFDLDDILFLAIFALITFGGVALGQLLAFLRVRTWLLLVGGGFCWVLYFGFAVATSQVISAMGEYVVIFVVATLLIGPIAMTGGLWSLETHRALWSTWLPMVYTVAAVIILIEDKGSLSVWKQGEKWAIWDLASLGMFLPSVGLFLLYLVTRETHRLAMWRRGPTAPLRPTIEERGVSRPRLTLVGFLALGFLTLVVGGATALVAPYLWRTGPPDCEGEHCRDPSGEPEPVPPDYEEGKNPFDGMDLPPEVIEMLQKMGEAAKDTGGTICTLLSIGLLALLGALIAWRPLKRLLVVKHLKDPFWAVPPTQRIEQGWRLVEIALGDAGVHPIPGEDAAGLARRAAPVLKALSPVEVHGLEDAAEVADRVRFGLGVSPGDAAVMDRFSGWAIDTVWERLDDRAQLAAMYRGI